MKYRMRAPKRRRWPRRLLIIGLALAVFFIGATFLVRRTYDQDLKAVSASQTTQLVVIKPGTGLSAIADLLKQKGLIRSSWAFKLYVSGKEVRDSLEAGTYRLSPSQSTPEIVSQITHGKIASTLVTILPGKRLDQLRQTFLDDGFKQSEVDAALNPAQYENEAVLNDKPAGANLEGYLYPDSFARTSSTSLKSIVQQSLDEMNTHLTPDVRAGFAKEGLSTYQGITLASIVEQEVASQSDRNQVAQVFLSRLAANMSLGSDVTAYYGAILAGQKPSVNYASPYNTLQNKGLPPGPIANVNASALEAVAHPATTSWLYFVTGDNGVTYFSQTLQQHQQYTAQYCHTLCSQ